MHETVLQLHSGFAVAPVDERIFGGFLEHLGRAVYGGVCDPAPGRSDDQGVRKDVLDALRRLRMTAMRYPGGNFASGYHWRDGVGPLEQRPAVRDLAWQSIEPNRFGTDEFLSLCRKAEWTPMLAVNMGTGTPEEARDWVEYCNCPVGTKFADMRAANGQTQPHGVRLWCLGNEMDGKWQLGHVPAEQYAVRAQQAAKMMKGQFTLEDMAAQFRQLRKMGSLEGLLGMIPGVGKIKNQMSAADMDDKIVARQEAIILSMTAKERRNPKVLNGSRRRRIATGSGTSVQEVNRLLKQFKQMSAMLKKAGKMGKRGMMGGLPPGMMPPPHMR